MATSSNPIDTAFVEYFKFQSAVDQIFASIQLGPDVNVVNMDTMMSIHKDMGKICSLYEAVHGSVVDMYTRITVLHARYSASVDRIQSFMGTKVGTDTIDNVWTLKSRRGARVMQPPPGFDTKVQLPAAPSPLGAAPVGHYAKVASVTPSPAPPPPHTLRPTPPSAPPVPVPQPVPTSMVSITDNIELAAIRVPTFDNVTTNGELYYVESCGHFAFRVAGVLFHAGVGDIYNTESEPIKIKECKYGDKCNRHDCTYYHDPIRCGNSRDIRNYVAASWLYAPPTSPLRTRKATRTFGSRQFLDSDISSVTGEECRRFMDQSSHDILCSLILSRYSTYV